MWGRYCIFQLQCCCGSVFLLNIMNSTSVTRVCCSKSRTLQSRSGVINNAVLSQIHGALVSQLTTDPLHQSTLHDWKHSRWLVTDWRPINTDTDGRGVRTGVDGMLYPFVWRPCALQLMLALECVRVCMRAFVFVYLWGVTSTLRNRNPPRSGLNNRNYTAAKSD